MNSPRLLAGQPLSMRGRSDAMGSSKVIIVAATFCKIGCRHLETRTKSPFSQLAKTGFSSSVVLSRFFANVGHCTTSAGSGQEGGPVLIPCGSMAVLLDSGSECPVHL